MATVKTSAGILPFRRGADGLEVLVGHMGGPFWAKKDDRAWSIFKGEYDGHAEDPVVAARREFVEETGQPMPAGDLLPLGEVVQGRGKRVVAWAVEAPSLVPETFVSNTFEMEWPPRSGRTQTFPEIDRARWMGVEEAEAKLVAGQVAFLTALGATVADG